MTKQNNTVAELMASALTEAASETDKPKLCKDCRHCMPERTCWWFCLCLPLAPFFAWCALSDQYRMARCRLFKSPTAFGDSLTGGRIRGKDQFMFCSNAREFKCGHDAKFFEAR